MTVFECAADLGVLPSPVKCLSERFFQTGRDLCKILPKAVRYSSDVIPAQAGIQLGF